MSIVNEPKVKTFNSTPYRDLINGLTEHMDGKQFERACTGIVKDILKVYEGFEKVEKGPQYNGTPFDFFVFKMGKPYIIEFKGSLEYYHTPGETQKRRIQELRRRIKGLHIALVQVKLNASQYRIFYDDQMTKLFEGPEMPLDRIEEWIRNKLA